MFEEKRASPRQIVHRPARVKSLTDEVFVDCIVEDISLGGVRLTVSASVPDPFLLEILDEPNVYRKCQTVWQLDNEIGAEFIDAAE